MLGTKFRIEQEQLPNASAWIREQIEISLKRLGQDSVDLFNLHNRIVFDAASNPRGSRWRTSSVAEGLQKVREAGLTRMIGITRSRRHGGGQAGRRLGTVRQRPDLRQRRQPVGRLGRRGRGRGQNFDRLLDTIAEHRVGAVGIRVLAAGALTLTPISGRHQNTRRSLEATRSSSTRSSPTWSGRNGSRRWPPSWAWKAGRAELPPGHQPPRPLDGAGGRLRPLAVRGRVRWVERGPLDEATVGAWWPPASSRSSVVSYQDGVRSPGN